MSSFLNLLDLKPGQACTLESIEPVGIKIALKLQELGLTPGVALVFLRRSPMGDLLAFTLRGTFIALRREAAACIRVRL
jgi:ferrous iron transport protein A